MMIKLLIFRLIKRVITNPVIISAINSEITRINNSSNRPLLMLGDNSKVFNGAHIVNGRLQCEDIIIKSNSHVLGTLLTFRYGGRIEIGDWCYVGDLTRIWSGESVKIGNNVLLSHNVFITDTTAHELEYEIRAERYKELIKSGFPATKSTIKTRPIVIEDYVWINPNSIILPGVTIGRGAIIASGSVVTKDVAPFTMVAGNPARFIKDLPK